VFPRGVNRWQQLAKQPLSDSVKLPKGNKVKKVSPGTDMAPILVVSAVKRGLERLNGRFSGWAAN